MRGGQRDVTFERKSELWEKGSLQKGREVFVKRKKRRKRKKVG